MSSDLLVIRSGDSDQEFSDCKVETFFVKEGGDVIRDDRDEIKIFYGDVLIAHGPRGGNVGAHEGLTELKLFTVEESGLLDYHLSPDPVHVEITYQSDRASTSLYPVAAIRGRRLHAADADTVDDTVVFINTVLDNGVPTIRRGVFSRGHRFAFDNQWGTNDMLSKLQPRFKRLPKHDGDYALVRARQDTMINIGGPLGNWYRHFMREHKGIDSVDVEWDASCKKDADGRNIYEVTVYTAHSAAEAAEAENKKRSRYAQTWDLDLDSAEPFEPPIVHCAIVNGKKRRRCVAELDLTHLD